VGSQLSYLEAYLEAPSGSLAQRILDRCGYSNNLKTRIHDSCINRIADCNEDGDATQSLRAIESVATHLERIAELCRDCVHQMSHLSEPKLLRSDEYSALLERVSWGVEMTERAISDHDTQLALKIGRIESRLDQDYEKQRKQYTAALKRRKNTEDLICAVFVAHLVEQMGDALLTISEAVISFNLGQVINTDRYQSMKASVTQLNKDEKLKNLVVEPIAETRSGSGISGISAPGREDEGYVAVFKDGEKRKLKEERQGVESWHEIYPGLAPKILSYHKRGQSAALLIEHLAGMTFFVRVSVHTDSRVDVS